MKILLFCSLFVSCKAPEVIREYAPAQIVVSDSNEAPQTIIVGKCTTVVERNNTFKETRVTTTSAPDTFFKEAPKISTEPKKPFFKTSSFIIPALYILSGLFLLESVLKFIKAFRKQ